MSGAPKDQGPSHDTEPCGECHRCLDAEDAENPSAFGLLRSVFSMVLCSECGNKRCPHATDHRLNCTGSNDLGQPGSIFVDRWAHTDPCCKGGPDCLCEPEGL